MDLAQTSGSEFFASLAAIVCAPSIQAAEIELHKGDDGFDIISLEGEIVAGDDEKFKQLALSSDSAVVIMSSDGGALLPALEIGRTIQIKGFATYVPDDTTCTSACALIWLAGSKRLLASTARIGFHASYRDRNGNLEEVGLGNAMVGRYITLLNLPERAIIFATSASPTEVRWLDDSLQTESGIPFSVFDLEVDAPPAPPTVYRTTPIDSIRPNNAAEYHSQVAWYYAGETMSKSLVYVRAEDVSQGSTSNRAAPVWIRMNSSRDNTVDHMTSIGRFTVNCVSKSYSANSLILYYRDGRNEDSPVDSTTKYIASGSVLESAVDLLCSDKYPIADERDILKG